MNLRWLAALAVAVSGVTPTAAPAGAGLQVVIETDRLEPKTLEAVTGERVTFVNRTGRPVHLQFSGELHGHDVVQVPATGPVWAVFHRPGSHPYIVHIYGREARALEGVVSVTSDATHLWQLGTCDVVVEGNCLAR